MISKTQLERRMKRKTNPELVATLLAIKHLPAWNALAQRLANSTRQHASVNLTAIDRVAKEGDTIIVPGSVLATGTLSKKITICALHYSAHALEKIKMSKSTVRSLREEVEKNQKAQGVTLL